MIIKRTVSSVLLAGWAAASAVAAAALSAAALSTAAPDPAALTAPAPAAPKRAAFSITSGAFQPGGTIPKVHECTSSGDNDPQKKNESPPFAWSGGPAEAKSCRCPSGSWWPGRSPGTCPTGPGRGRSRPAGWCCPRWPSAACW